MPTYGYRCPACSAEFDVWQKMTDEPVATCPTCGTAARRQFFPAGIVFKGSGFYATDSRKSASATSAPAAAANGKSDNGNKSDSSNKSDTAATSETKTSTEKTSPASGSDKTS